MSKKYPEKIYNANIIGDGAIAQGKGAVAIGDNSVNIIGDGNIIGDRNFSEVIEDNDLKELLRKLSYEVGQIIEKLPKELADELRDDLDHLIEEAAKEKPRRKWWSISVDGLAKAAGNFGDADQPIFDLLEKILPLLVKNSA